VENPLFVDVFPNGKHMQMTLMTQLTKPGDTAQAAIAHDTQPSLLWHFEAL
jgi:hypothetical protein